MKNYKFLDPSDDKYEIVVPSEVVKDIVMTHMRTTYYWSVGMLCFLIGTFFGLLIK